MSDKRPRDERRVFLATYGSGPWPCVVCGEDVQELGPRGHIHHRDHDNCNNAAKNLSIAHATCHMRHHKGGKPSARKGVTLSPETRRKISEKLKGRKLSAETRARMSAARQRDRALIAEKSKRAWAEGRGRNQWTQ